MHITFLPCRPYGRGLVKIGSIALHAYTSGSHGVVVPVLVMLSYVVLTVLNIPSYFLQKHHHHHVAVV